MRVPLFRPARAAVILGVVSALTFGTIANSYAGDLPVFVNGKHMMWGREIVSCGRAIATAGTA
ncbi:MAG TPA: hypothetical protein VF898_13300, partial [Chloroflexota bacterium]